MRSREDYAWCAGFFEGEGSFDLARHQDRPVPRIHIAQRDREPLDQFQQLIGIEGNLYHRLDGGKDIWTLYYNRWAGVQAIVCFMWPWLSTRRRTRAIEVLREGAPRLRKRPTHCKRGHELTEENSRLDRHGWRACRICIREGERTRKK
jgi:hypothetical protein